MFNANIKVAIDLHQNWPDAQSGAFRNFSDNFELKVSTDEERREAVRHAAVIAGEQLRLLAAAVGATFEDGSIVQAFTAGWLND